MSSPSAPPAPRPARMALTGPQIVAKLAQTPDWRLSGDGEDLAIEKTFRFASYLHTLSFVNAVAFLAEQQDHHPDMLVGYRSCSVRWRSHDVKGISARDFECAVLVDALSGESTQSGPHLG